MKHDGCRRIPSAGSVPACSVPPTRCLRGFHAADYPFVFPQSAPTRQSGPSHPTSHQSTLGARCHLSLTYTSCPCSHVGDGCLFVLTAEISPPKSLALSSCLDRPSSSTPGRGTVDHRAPSDTAGPFHPPNIADLPGETGRLGCLSVHQFTCPEAAFTYGFPIVYTAPSPFSMFVEQVFFLEYQDRHQIHTFV